MVNLNVRLDVDLGKDNAAKIVELAKALVPDGAQFTIIREMEDFNDFAHFEGAARFTADGAILGKTSGRPSGTIAFSVQHKGGSFLYTIEPRLNHVMVEYNPDATNERLEPVAVLKFTWLSREGMHGRRNILAIEVHKTPEMA